MTEIKPPELITLHLYRDTCAGGFFISAQPLDLTLHEHVQELVIRRDKVIPGREKISEGEVLSAFARSTQGIPGSYSWASGVAAILNGADQ